MTEFTKRYQQLSDKELLEIVANASSYQAKAVETAKHELASRKLSEEQIAIANTKISREKQQKEKQIQKRKEENKALKNDFFSLFNTVNPFKPELELYEKQIRFMCWFFAAIALYTVMTNFSLMQFYFDDLFEGKIDAEFVLYFVNIIAIVLGAILFWKRKTLGWILTTFYMVTGIVGLVISLIYNISNPRYVGFTALGDSFITTDVIGMYFFGGLFFGTNLYVLLKEKVKNVFKIDTTIVLLTIILAAAIQLFMWIALFAN